jgi:hypothetical protein
MSLPEILGLAAGGGGGGGGAVTSTVTERISFPPALLALRVYVVVFVGNTWRMPLAWTLPTPLFMAIVVALATDQFKVADWPLSTERGSTLKLLIRALGAAGGGAGAGASCGGGGGGGGGTFFLHAVTAIINTTANTAALSVL